MLDWSTLRLGHLISGSTRRPSHPSSRQRKRIEKQEERTKEGDGLRRKVQRYGPHPNAGGARIEGWVLITLVWCLSIYPVDA